MGWLTNFNISFIGLMEINLQGFKNLGDLGKERF
jgi:hypothetical protein